MQPVSKKEKKLRNFFYQEEDIPEYYLDNLLYLICQ